MNNRLFVLLPILAMVVLMMGAISPTFAQVSIGGTVGVGTTTTPTTTTTTPPIRHFHDFHHHGFLGLGGLGLNAGLNTAVGGAFITGTTIPGFTTFRDFAHAHNEHFVLLNNRFVLLPSTVSCPEGTVLQATGECAILQGQETVVQQEAPTILQEQIQAPANIVTTESEAAQPATATETTQTETTQTQTEQPIISCPTGATLQPDNTCSTTVTVQQQQQQNVQPIITCPTGSTLQGGQCIEQQQQITVDPLPCPTCPPGSGLVNGQCVVSALPSQVTTGSTTGQIIVLGHTFEHHGLLPFLHFRH